MPHSKGFKVFHRTRWQRNPGYPNGREPGCGPRHTIARHVATEESARSICKVWDANHPEGKYSDRAEYTAE